MRVYTAISCVALRNWLAGNYLFIYEDDGCSSAHIRPTSVFARPTNEMWIVIAGPEYLASLYEYQLVYVRCGCETSH